MAAQSALHRFAISTSGDGSYDAVYGVARCDGDMSHKACSACITGLEHAVRAICPHSGAVDAWREKCFLHYDVTNFLGKWDLKYAIVGTTSKSIADDPKAFQQRVAELMGELMAEAAGARETLKFKYGESSPKGYSDSNVTIYGMAQCTQDLSESECNLCFEKSLEIIALHCGGSVGCAILGGSCPWRYEIYKFLWIDDAAGVEAPTPAPSIDAGY